MASRSTHQREEFTSLHFGFRPEALNPRWHRSTWLAVAQAKAKAIQQTDFTSVWDAIEIGEEAQWCPGRESYATTDMTNRCFSLVWWRE
jgi:hypothetical protein